MGMGVWSGGDQIVGERTNLRLYEFINKSKQTITPIGITPLSPYFCIYDLIVTAVLEPGSAFKLWAFRLLGTSVSFVFGAPQ